MVRSPYAGIVKLFPYTGSDVVTIPLYLNGLNGVGEKGMHVNQGDSNQGNCLTLGRNSQKQLGFFYYKNNFIQPYHAYLTANTINARMVEFDDVTDLDIADVSEEPTQEVEADLFDDLFAYKKSDDGTSCRAVWYYGDPQNITIPAEVEGIPVTAMGKNVFLRQRRARLVGHRTQQHQDAARGSQGEGQPLLRTQRQHHRLSALCRCRLHHA